MATDFRYMKLGRGPGSTWFFVYNIPKELRGHPLFMTSRGKPMTKVTESLGTTDPEQARELRNRRVVYWDRQFRMLRDGPSEDDIREEAIEVYRATLRAWFERPAGWDSAQLRLHLNARHYTRRLDDAIGMQAAKEIADYCERAGVSLEPGTEPYRKFGIEFIKMKIAAGDGEAWLPWPDGRTIHGGEAHLPPLPKIEPPIPAEPNPIPDPMRVKVFIDKVGDLPLGKITEHMAVEFLDGYLLSEREHAQQLRHAVFSSLQVRASAQESDGKPLRWPTNQGGGCSLRTIHRPGACHAIRRCQV